MNTFQPDYENPSKDEKPWMPSCRSTRVVYYAAKKRKLLTSKVLYKNKKRLAVANENRKYIFWAGGCNINDPDQVSISNSKVNTQHALELYNCSLTKGVLFTTDNICEITKHISEIGFPVIIKPDRGTKGKGVTKIDSYDEFKKKWDDVFRKWKDLVVEKMFVADEYRFTCVNGIVQAIVRRVPAYVVGDQIKTIRQLIDEKNVLRSKKPSNPPILIDDDLLDTLSKSNHTLDDIPPKDTVVKLRFKSNVSMGGEAIDFTDRIHSSYIREVERVSIAFKNILITGWDVMIKNYRDKATKDNWVILEVNSAPMISLHYWPWRGKKRNVAIAAVDYLFSNVTPVSAVNRIFKMTIKGEYNTQIYLTWLNSRAEHYQIQGKGICYTNNMIEVIASGSNFIEFFYECYYGPVQTKVESILIQETCLGQPKETQFMNGFIIDLIPRAIDKDEYDLLMDKYEALMVEYKQMKYKKRRYEKKYKQVINSRIWIFLDKIRSFLRKIKRMIKFIF